MTRQPSPPVRQAQERICADLQRQAMIDVPSIPVGQVPSADYVRYAGSPACCMGPAPSGTFAQADRHAMRMTIPASLAVISSVLPSVCYATVLLVREASPAIH